MSWTTIQLWLNRLSSGIRILLLQQIRSCETSTIDCGSGLGYRHDALSSECPSPGSARSILCSSGVPKSLGLRVFDPCGMLPTERNLPATAKRLAHYCSDNRGGKPGHQLSSSNSGGRNGCGLSGLLWVASGVYYHIVDLGLHSVWVVKNLNWAAILNMGLNNLFSIKVLRSSSFWSRERRSNSAVTLMLTGPSSIWKRELKKG